MNAMLATEFLEEDDFGKAASELLENAERLIIGGCFEEAHAVLQGLIRQGAWRGGGHGRITKALETLLPLACHLTGRPSPAIGETPAMSVADLVIWADVEAEQISHSLAMPIRHQHKAAGENWSVHYLQRLPAIADMALRREAFQDFLSDAEFVLKARLADGSSRSPVNAAGLLGELKSRGMAAGLLNALTDALGHLTAPIRVDPAAQEIPTALIADTVAACLCATGLPANYLASFVFHAATVLALGENRPEEAAIAAGMLANAEMGRVNLARAAVWPPLAELLGSGACAGALGVDATAASRYLAALQRRLAPPEWGKESGHWISGND